MKMEISSADLITLKKFANKEHGTTIQDAHSVLSNMIIGVQPTQGYPQETRNELIATEVSRNLNVLLISLSVMSLCIFLHFVELHCKISWFRISATLLMTLFLVSVPWHWWHMYQVVVAKRQAAALKDMPVSCRAQSQTVGRTIIGVLKSAFSLRDDECAQYHEAMLVDPILEVPPTKALAVTVVRFIVEPLEHIGSAIGRMIRGTLQDLPVHLWPVALAFVAFVTFLLLTMACGYKARFFYIFGMEPGHQTEFKPKHQQLEFRIQELTNEIERLKVSLVSESEKKGVVMGDDSSTTQNQRTVSVGARPHEFESESGESGEQQICVQHSSLPHDGKSEPIDETNCNKRQKHATQDDRRNSPHPTLIPLDHVSMDK